MNQLMDISKSAFLLLHRGMRERASLMSAKKSFERNGWKNGIKKGSVLTPRRRRLLKKSVVNLQRERPRMENCIRQFIVTMKQIMHIATDVEELETFILAASEQTMPTEKVEVIHLAAIFGDESVSLERGLSNWCCLSGSDGQENKVDKTGFSKEDPGSSSSTDESDLDHCENSDGPVFSGDDCEQNESW